MFKVPYPPAAATKSSDKTFGAALKMVLWDMYVGDDEKESPCYLCDGKNTMYKTQNSGFVAAHVISRYYMRTSPTTELSKYYGIPSCTQCNNCMGDTNMFDYLYQLDRIHVLRRVITIICKTFLKDRGHLIEHLHERTAWHILDHLYGQHRFMLGGHIVNTKPIYEIARMEQISWLMAEAAIHAEALKRIYAQHAVVVCTPIKPLKIV